MRGAWPSRSSRWPGPISKLQSDILLCIAGKRDPASFFAIRSIAPSRAIHLTSTSFATARRVLPKRHSLTKKCLSRPAIKSFGCDYNRPPTTPWLAEATKRQNSSGSPIATIGSSPSFPTINSASSSTPSISQSRKSSPFHSVWLFVSLRQPPGSAEHQPDAPLREPSRQ